MHTHAYTCIHMYTHAYTCTYFHLSFPSFVHLTLQQLVWDKYGRRNTHIQECLSFSSRIVYNKALLLPTRNCKYFRQFVSSVLQNSLQIIFNVRYQTACHKCFDESVTWHVADAEPITKHNIFPSESDKIPCALDLSVATNLERFLFLNQFSGYDCCRFSDLPSKNWHHVRKCVSSTAQS